VNEEHIPVVIGVGQSIERDVTVSALDMCERAGRAALEDAPGIASSIDRVTVVDILSNHGSAPATDLAARLGLESVVVETTVVGGNTPQLLVNRAAEEISRGALTTTLVVGAEAMRSARTGDKVSYGGKADRPDDVFGVDRLGVGDAEMGIGLLLPAQIYAMVDSAVAAAARRTSTEHRRKLAELFAPFSEVAAKHPFAWFAEPVTAAELSTVTDSNRVVSEPYTKRLCAFLNVDQGAAFVVCSLAAARAAGLADQAVFVWSGADAIDVWEPSARPDVGASPAIAAAAGGALSSAGVAIDDVGVIDLYSCFPAAVQLAASAIGIEGTADRPLTLTGGLPYFGGPGNNYSTHAIATAVERLRERSGHALVGALGWYVTKHSYGVYGANPPPDRFQRADLSAEQAAIDESARPVASPNDEVSGRATVVASTRVPDRDGAITSAPVFADLDDGRRVVAGAADPSSVPPDLVGSNVIVDGQTYRVED
jgi:acetyl-CoA C-acetyltransferase